MQETGLIKKALDFSVQMMYIIGIRKGGKMEYKGYTIDIEQDYSAEDPRDWDNLGTMICFHKRYQLGDKGHGVDTSDYSGWAEMEAELRKEYAVVLPLYLYDHSGITMKVTPFFCPWDSGQVGYIVVSRETILKEYGGSRLTSQKLEKAKSVLIGEVETYDMYLCGEVYSYMVPGLAEEDDNYDYMCSGYYGHEEAVKAAKEVIDSYIAAKEKNCGVQQELAV